MRSSFAASSSAMSPVPSGEASSTIITSASGAAVRTLATKVGRFSRSLKVGVTMSVFKAAMLATTRPRRILDDSNTT